VRVPSMTSLSERQREIYNFAQFYTFRMRHRLSSKAPILESVDIKKIKEKSNIHKILV
jgi:hypothetical protein